MERYLSICRFSVTFQNAVIFIFTAIRILDFMFDKLKNHNKIIFSNCVGILLNENDMLKKYYSCMYTGHTVA
jgi:hypothetical protein